MVDQTPMNNGRSTGRGSGSALRANVAGLLHDGITLAELQTQLLSLDVQEMQKRSVRPLLLIMGAVVLALGTVPVLLLSIGWGLVNMAGWSEGAAFLTVAAGGLLAAVAAGWAGWRTLRSALSTLSRSKSELTQNVQWMKSALKRRSSPG